MKLFFNLVILLGLICLGVESKADGKLKIGGTNVCSKVFNYQSYIYETRYYTGYLNYETCCKKFIWCASECTKYRSVTKSYRVSILIKRTATSVYCCPGWARTQDNPEQCLQAICKPRCLNGDCVKPNVCNCKAGFTGQYCEQEINECTTSPCEQTCTNLRGSYSCSCKRGFRKIVNQTIGEARSPRCENIDECKINEQLINVDNDTTKAICKCAISGNGCKASCINTIGSYKCQCSQGFRLVANRVCTDVDECRANQHNCDQICINKRNGYDCYCYPGYKLAADNRTCIDVNECSVSSGGCEQLCTNTDGSFRCSCKKGYLLLSDDFRCKDIDECRISRPCDQFNGYCVNEPGNYQCRCKPGYILNYDGKTCRDIDECSRSNNCEHNCFNLGGSYACGCKIGYTLKSDGHSCQDIDECAGDLNSCNQLCENTPGSYKCKCRPGYMLDFDGKTCIGLPCPVVQPPYRGSVKCTGKHVGDHCQFSCNVGYILEGDTSPFKCLNGSLWEKRDVKCVADQCREAKPIENGILSQPCMEKFQSTCLVRCKPDYKLKGSHQIHCQSYQNRTMYWNVKAECEKITLCNPDPCVRGVCRLLSTTTYHCDCSNTGYIGQHCHIGVVKTPELPQMDVNVVSDDLYIQAKPSIDLLFTMTTDPPNAIQFFPNNALTLYGPHKKEVEFQIKPIKSGIIRIKYQMTGKSSSQFLQPADTLLLVKPATSSEEMTTLPKHSFMENNCHPMKITQCEAGKRRMIQLKTNCPWRVSGSKGYVSVDDENLNLPLSLAGVSFLEKDGLKTFAKSGILTVARETQHMLVAGRQTCSSNSKPCGGRYFSKDDHDFIVKRNLFANSYLIQIQKETPWWLSMSLPFDYTGFHTNDVQSLLVRDSRINDLKCVNKPQNMKGLYSAMVMQAPLQIQIQSSIIKMESLYHTCLFKSLCDRGTFVSFPLDVSRTLTISGAKMLSIEVNGLGVGGGVPLSSKCVNLTEAVSGNIREECVKANAWAKGYVNLTTSDADIKFNGEMYIENNDLNKAVVERFSSEHKIHMSGRVTTEFNISIHGNKLGLMFRDKPAEIVAIIGGKNSASSCSPTCKTNGVHFQHKSSHLEPVYRISVLRIEPNPTIEMSTHVHYGIFNGVVTGTSMSLLNSIVRYSLRGLPRTISAFTRYSLTFPIEVNAIKTESKKIEQTLRTIQTLLRDDASYEKVFSELVHLRQQGVTLVDAVTMFRDAVVRKSPSTVSRIMGSIRRLIYTLKGFNRVLMTPEVAKTTETDNGLSVRYTGKICIYQLCFDNSWVTIQQFQSGCSQCGQKLDDQYVHIKATSRKMRQVSSSIKIPSGGVTSIKLSKGGINNEGAIYIVTDAVVSFLENIYNVTIYVNGSLMYFDIKDVMVGDYRFDVHAKADIDPTTTWKRIRFFYHGLPSNPSKINNKFLEMSDEIILRNVQKITKRLKDFSETLEESKNKMTLYGKEKDDLKKIFDVKYLTFKKAESDYNNNKTRYKSSLESYRGYFTLDFLRQIQSNLSQVCEFKKCTDTCHTMRLFDICQKKKPIETKEMRCIPERKIDRTTVLEPFKTLCDLTNYNFKKIYTGTCSQSNEETLQGALIGVGTGIGFLAGGPVGAGIGAVVGWVLSLHSSCDTSFETLKLVNNYQETCTLKQSVTKTQIFYVSKCLPFPTTVLSEYGTPHKCLVSNTSCIPITDGGCLYDNNECRKKQDIKRRNMLEHRGVYNDSWNNLNFYQTKLDGLFMEKQRTEKAMVEAKRLYERKLALWEAEKLNSGFAQNAIDNIGVELSLEKCFLDFYVENNKKNKSILSYSGTTFKTRLTSVESLSLEMSIDGDARQGKQNANFLLYFEDNGVSLARGVRKMVQYYLCKRHSRRRRSITDRHSITPFARHDNQRDVSVPGNVTDHNIECLHATTIFTYLNYLLTSLKDDITEAVNEKSDLTTDLTEVEKTIAKLALQNSDELVQRQIEILDDLRKDGLKEISELSTTNVLSDWKQKMEIYTKSYNFTSCFGLKDCIDVALDNLIELPSKFQVDHGNFIKDIRRFAIDLANFSKDKTSTLTSLKEDVRSVFHFFKNIKDQTMFCDTEPEVMLTSPTQIDAFKGEKVLLQCKVKSTSKFVIHWIKNGELLSFENKATLAIYIDETSAGHYRCIARNKAGNSTSSATHVVLRQKPVILMEPEDFTYLTTDENQKIPFFICNVTADPIANITWYFQPFSQASSLKLSRKKQPVLLIPAPKPSTAGFYYCFASNRFGSTYSKKARLFVLTSKIAKQDLSVSFDVPWGSIDNINKTELNEKAKEASNLKQYQTMEMDVSPSGEDKVKFVLNVEEEDEEQSNIAVFSDSLIVQDNIMMIKAVSSRRQSLSQGVTRVVGKITEAGDSSTINEVQHSAVLGFDGSRCQQGFKIHSNGFACVPCEPGTYESNRFCISCPVGSYQPSFGMTNCKMCEQGKVTENVAATGLHDCVKPVLKSVNLVFVVESSGFLTSTDFQNIITYIVNFFKTEVSSHADVKFALISFAGQVTVEVPLASNEPSIVNKLKNMRQKIEKSVEMHTALIRARKLLDQNGGDNRQGVIITVSKTPSTIKTAILRNTAMKIQNDGIQIVSVTAGPLNGHQSLILASMPKAVNHLSFKDTIELKTAPSEELASTILRGRCGSPEIDVGILIESNINTRAKVWDVAMNFITSLTKRISKRSNIDMGLVSFDQQPTPLLNATHKGTGKMISALGSIRATNGKVDVVSAMEFVINHYLTEEYGFENKRKIMIVFSNLRVSDDDFAQINRLYDEESVLILNVLMGYQKQDLGIADIGVEESMQSVFSLSELDEITRRIMGILSEVTSSGCYINK